METAKLTLMVRLQTAPTGLGTAKFDANSGVRKVPCFFCDWLSDAYLISSGAVCNRTIGVNLRKEPVCPRALHCASYIQRKEAQ